MKRAKLIAAAAGFAGALLPVAGARASEAPDDADVREQAMPPPVAADESGTTQQDLEARLEAYRWMGGGLAYKLGLVRRTEAELARIEPASDAAPPSTAEAKRFKEERARLAAMGAMAYKAGDAYTVDGWARSYVLSYEMRGQSHRTPEAAHPPYGWGKPIELAVERSAR
jgi:hypothetical protein